MTSLSLTFLLGTIKMLAVPASWAVVSIQWVNTSKTLRAGLGRSARPTTVHSCLSLSPQMCPCILHKNGIQLYTLICHSPFYLAICHEQPFRSQNTFHSIPSNYCRLNGGPTVGLTNPLSLGSLPWSQGAASKSLRLDVQVARQVSKGQGHSRPHGSHRWVP